MASLTERESRLLRMIRRGAEASRDRERPHLLIFQHPEVKSFRTQDFMVRRLQHRRLIVPGTNMLRLELTQEGFARLDGSPHEGKPTLPAGLLPLARTKAMAKLHELRREGFADPVDALLAIAYETNEEGEWAQPIDIRIQCLTAAAPYCRPNKKELRYSLGKVFGGNLDRHTCPPEKTSGRARWLLILRAFVSHLWATLHRRAAPSGAR